MMTQYTPEASRVMAGEVGLTFSEHIAFLERSFPDATGEFTTLMREIMLAGKIISSKVRRAGLVLEMGRTGRKNIQGEDVQFLDDFAHQTMLRTLAPSGTVCVMASEEAEETIPIPEPFGTGKYAVAFDPLDGSSNVDVNVSTGTIFSIYERVTESGPGTLSDFLQSGSHMVGAGYLIYGSSTMLVYAAKGCHAYGFTLDPAVGEFLLSHPEIRTPVDGTTYSANEGYTELWNERDRTAVAAFRSPHNPAGAPLTARYVGSLVADFHRNLLVGGIFLYPGTKKHPEGKLRLLYEAAPLAFVCEAAGGIATTGVERILDIEPRSLHQRVPLVIGSKREVEFVMAAHRL